MKKYFYVLTAFALISCGASDKKSKEETAEQSSAKVETVETKAEPKAEPKAEKQQPINKGTVKSTADIKTKNKKPIISDKELNTKAIKMKTELKDGATKTATKVKKEVKAEVSKNAAKKK